MLIQQRGRQCVVSRSCHESSSPPATALLGPTAWLGKRPSFRPYIRTSCQSLVAHLLGRGDRLVSESTFREEKVRRIRLWNAAGDGGVVSCTPPCRHHRAGGQASPWPGSLVNSIPAIAPAPALALNGCGHGCVAATTRGRGTEWEGRQAADEVGSRRPSIEQRM